METADKHAVPAGGALAIDRVEFSNEITKLSLLPRTAASFSRRFVFQVLVELGCSVSGLYVR